MLAVSGIEPLCHLIKSLALLFGEQGADRGSLPLTHLVVARSHLLSQRAKLVARIINNAADGSRLLSGQGEFVLERLKEAIGPALAPTALLLLVAQAVETIKRAAGHRAEGEDA